MKVKTVIGAIGVSLLVGMKLFANGAPQMETMTNREIVFLEENKLMYMPDMEKDEAPICIMEVEPSTSDNKQEYTIQFSENGKYAYLLEIDKMGAALAAFNDEPKPGTLYAIDLEALTEDQDKNKAYIHKVDTDVCENFKVIGDGQMSYIKSNHKLVYYDSSDPNTKTNKRSLCYATLDGNVKVVDESSEAILDYDCDNKCIYFTEEHISKQSLYDLIEDTFAKSDAEMTKSQTGASFQCQERNALRKALKSEQFEVVDREIYCFQNGMLTKLTEKA